MTEGMDEPYIKPRIQLIRRLQSMDLWKIYLNLDSIVCIVSNTKRPVEVIEVI